MSETDEQTFDPALDPEVLHFGESTPPATACPWCGEPLPTADLDACPHCHALLKPTEETLDIPGVTTLAPEVRRILEVAEAKRRKKAKPRFRSEPDAPSLAAMPEMLGPAEEIAALRPPDAEVKRVMRELEAAARRANGPRVEPPVPLAADLAPEPGVEPTIEPAPDLHEAPPTSDPGAGPAEAPRA